MTNPKSSEFHSHVVDVLGSTRGRDQIVMRFDSAMSLVGCIADSVLGSADTTILDPFCKAGEVLLAAALRTMIALEGNIKSPVTIDAVRNQLYGTNYCAISPDKRHFLLSKRTFYGNSHSSRESTRDGIFNGQYLSEETGKLDEKLFEKALKSMLKFIKDKNPGTRIIAVGNPPYQEADGGAGASARPIYNLFIDKLIECEEIAEIVVVIPARWFAGGKSPLEEFRGNLVNSRRIKKLVFFERSEDIFPAVQVKGGICFLHWQRDYSGKTDFVSKNTTHAVDLSTYDIIPDDPMAHSIIKKIRSSDVKKFVSDSAWPRKAFGLSTDYFKKRKDRAVKRSDSIKCYTNNMRVETISRDEVVKRKEHIDRWKVAVPGAYGKGGKRCTVPKEKIFIMGPGEVATETYNIIDSFTTEAMATKFASFLRTDFCRYLLGLRKQTQHITKERWAWVPYMDLNRSLDQSALENYFHLDQAEIDHIRQKVKEWS